MDLQRRFLLRYGQYDLPSREKSTAWFAVDSRRSRDVEYFASRYPNVSTPAKIQRKKAAAGSPAQLVRVQSAEKPKPTKGSKLAREMRQECNQLNDEQRAVLLNEAMAAI